MADSKEGQSASLDVSALSDIATNGKLLNEQISELISALGELGGIVWPVSHGGTGITSYTIGDLLYASGTTTLSKLSDVATGNALISGGVGVAPSYGKIDLTTTVSGILPVANGGTGRASHTAYAVICGGTTTTAAQQSIASVGTTGQVLTSNGPGSLPTFQTRPAWADGLGGMILYPDNQDYRIWLNAPFAMTITSTTTRSTTGTCTATFKINTTALGGSANSVSTSEQTQNHSTSNSVAAGDDIVITISANSSCENMSFMIAYTRS